MTRANAIACAEGRFDRGVLRKKLAELVAFRTESQNPESGPSLCAFLLEHIAPIFTELGFTYRLLSNPSGAPPFLFAERLEDKDRPTVLMYGHGDVTGGQEADWSPGLSPWALVERDGAWYGRGTADNKGQLAINLEALASILEIRGELGWNAKYLIEMGEEIGSPGLRTLCAEHREVLAANVLIASDGPRFGADRPTIFLGSRCALTFDLIVKAREGGRHSGNWGGVISNPAIQLAHAIANITSQSGRILIPEWLPDDLSMSVRNSLAPLDIASEMGDADIDPDWGEPQLSPAEQLFGWCSFDVLAMKCGDPEMPMNAIPGEAWARCQLRYVVGVNPYDALDALRRHLGERNLDVVKVEPTKGELFPATRLNPDDPWVRWVADSLARTLLREPVILPNLGGTVPNDAFSEILGLPTIWIPHSYPKCSQHAPNEHMLMSVARQGVSMMAGVFWDLGGDDTPDHLPVDNYRHEPA